MSHQSIKPTSSGTRMIDITTMEKGGVVARPYPTPTVGGTISTPKPQPQPTK
jgi:hypothetical protein